MKTKVTFALLIVCLAAVEYSYAGHGEQTRNRCRNWQYKVRTDIALGIVPVCYHTNHSCGQNIAVYCGPYGSCNATSESHNGPSGHWGVSNGCGGYWAGLANDFQRYTGLTLNYNSNSAGTHDYACIPTFATSSLKLDFDHIRFSQYIQSDDVVNYLRFYIWMPDTTYDDTTITPKKIIASCELKILNGSFTVTGDSALFTTSDFSVSTNNGWLSVTYIGASSKTVNFGSVRGEIMFSVEGDIMPDKQKLRQALIDISETETTFKLYPNPTNGRLHLSSGLATDGDNLDEISVDIFDASLKYVRSLTIIGKNGDLDVSNLPAGQYFLYLNDQGQKVVKAFNVQ